MLGPLYYSQRVLLLITWLLRRICNSLVVDQKVLETVQLFIASIWWRGHKATLSNWDESQIDDFCVNVQAHMCHFSHLHCSILVHLTHILVEQHQANIKVKWILWSNIDIGIWFSKWLHSATGWLLSSLIIYTPKVNVYWLSKIRIGTVVGWKMWNIHMIFIWTLMNDQLRLRNQVSEWKVMPSE